MLNTIALRSRPHVQVLILLSIISCIVFQSCQKSLDATNRGEITGKKKNPPPPPPPAPFYFSNCSYPVYSGTFTTGVAANVTFTMNYINSPGGSYAAFTSTTVNGLTITAPAGTLNVGSGSVVFTVTGTPIAGGIFSFSISVGSCIPCSVNITVLNAPANPLTCGGEPGPTPGSIGCVTFNYQGQTVTYYTVRANDGKIWLRQNLGSPQVAMNAWDEASFGDYFQWGRWDDGHQLKNSSKIPGSVSLMNPSHIAAGNSNFIMSGTGGTEWWSVGGAASDTWNGTNATATNGKDPCVALGTGWRMASLSDWQGVVNAEGITSDLDAFTSNLRLPSAGYRTANFGFVMNSVGGYYWTGSASGTNHGSMLFFDGSYNAVMAVAQRGYGFPCRCVK